jgi:hypothetical protein
MTSWFDLEVSDVEKLWLRSENLPNEMRDGVSKTEKSSGLRKKSLHCQRTDVTAYSAFEQGKNTVHEWSCQRADVTVYDLFHTLLS